MIGFLIISFTINLIYHHQVVFGTSQFPINVDEVKEYVESLMSIIEDKSCILSNENDKNTEKNPSITILQIQKAIQQLNETIKIYNMMKKKDKEHLHDVERYFFIIDRMFINFQIDVINSTQLTNLNYDFHVNKICTRIINRKSISEYMRMRYLPDYNEVKESIFTDAVSIYKAMDRVLWCDEKNFSWQLSLFHLFYHIIISELQIFMMDVTDYVLMLCYTCEGCSSYNKTDSELLISQVYNTDATELNINEKKKRLLFNVEQYLQSLKYAMDNSRKSIYQCLASNSIKGETYFELVNSCVSTGAVEEICNKNITDSQRYEELSSYKYDDSVPENSCRNKVLIRITLDKLNVFKLPQYSSEMCVRTCPLDNPMIDGVNTISFMEQISDIENNMVVTNVKFVEKNNMIQIQIEQGQLDKLNKFMINNNSTWKPLQEFKKLYYHESSEIKFYIDGNTIKETKLLIEGIDYVNINTNHKTLNLDDIILPVGYVVTGIKFGPHNPESMDWKSIEIQVRATLYNTYTNELIIFQNGKATSFWVTSKMMKPKLKNYNRLKLNYYDNEIRDAHSSELTWKPPDSQSNQYVDFIRSKIKIRGEQRTVPFFDARPTFSDIQLPLGGIGIFLKDYGSHEIYITFNTFPYPVSQIINI